MRKQVGTRPNYKQLEGKKRRQFQLRYSYGEIFSGDFKQIVKNLLYILKWVLWGALSGILIGLVVAALGSEHKPEIEGLVKPKN